MATWISLQPSLIACPYTRSRSPIFPGTRIGGFPAQTRPLRSSVTVAQFGFRPGFLPDPIDSVDAVKELLGRAEGLLYTIADAAVSSSDAVSTTATTKQNSDWLSGIANYMETVLKVLNDGLSTLHVPYAYGFAIILLTMLVKAATFPLTKKQVESAMSMRSLQPQIKAIQERYAGNQEKIQIETARLYKLAGINPLAGCLPTLATIPVWIGLYRALSNVADEGFLTEGFFWIPSLAGPTTVAARQMGSGTSWLFPFVDGQPPLGWSDTLAYLVLPLLLVVSQYISIEIMQSSQPQSNDPNVKNSQVITKFLPLMIGYFSLSVPSGLSLYWLTNNILSTAQQVYLQKFGGAKNAVPTFPDKIKEERPQAQKSVSELKISESTIVKDETREVKKSTPEGPRPGERFRLLKEQEARRKQKIEEERRKAEEAVVTANQNLAEQHHGEANLTDNKIHEKNHAVKGQDSQDAELTLNGKVSGQEMTENSEHQSDENVEKEYTTIVTETDKKTKSNAEEAEIN